MIYFVMFCFVLSVVLCVVLGR